MFSVQCIRKIGLLPSADWSGHKVWAEKSFSVLFSLWSQQLLSHHRVFLILPLLFQTEYFLKLPQVFHLTGKPYNRLLS